MEWSGVYHDGLTSARHKVRVHVEQGGLRVTGQDGTAHEFWPWRGLILAEPVFPGQPVRLRHRTTAEATLAVSDPGFLADLEGCSGRRFSGWLPRLTRPSGLAALMAAVAAAGALVVFGYQAAVPLLAHWVPLSWERRLGEAVVAQIAGEDQVCQGEAGLEVLRELAERLLAGHPEAPPFRIQVAELDVVNAFAVPGAEVVFMRGLIDSLETPEELAAVLSHELAHGLRRHPIEKLARLLGLRLLASAMAGDASLISGNLGQMAQVIVVNAYGREDELEADRIGLELLNEANIQGKGLITLLARLNKEPGPSDGLPQVFSTHPLNAERTALARSLARGTGAALIPGQWKAVKAICDK